MNILFGQTAVDGGTDDFQNIRRSLGGKYAGEFNVWPAGPGQPCIGWIRSSDKVLGKAEGEGLQVYLCGWLHGPLPGDWRGGRPMDSADAAADYLLKRYSALGLGFLDGIFGHYCVVVNDQDGGVLYLARDPRGSNQLFYHEEARGLTFSTGLYALGCQLGENLKIDRSLEDFFLVNGFYPWGRTLYRGVKELPGKTILAWRNRQTILHEYRADDPWSGRYEEFQNPGVTADSPGLTSTIHEAFMTAVEEQTAVDSGAAVLLGGFDSALLAAALKRLGKRVETFSYLYSNPIYNQPNTDLVSRHLGTRHHWIPVNDAVLADGLREYQWNFNLPSNYANFPIQTLHLARAIRDSGLEYCYSGATCDELFMGSSLTRMRAGILSSVGRIPPWLLNSLLWLCEWRGLERILGRPYHVFLGLLRSLGRDRQTRCFPGFNIFDPFSLSLLRNGVNPVQERESEDILDGICLSMPDLSPARLAALGLGVGAGGGGMIGKRGCLQKHGLVVNTPYGHPGLQAFIRGLPENLVSPPRKGEKRVAGKNLLKHMATQYGMLPSQVIYQPKRTAVDAPLEEWYAGLLDTALMDILKKLPFNYNRAYIENMVRLKTAERIYTRLFSGGPGNFMVITHTISLLTTYAAFMPKSAETDR